MAPGVGSNPDKKAPEIEVAAQRVAPQAAPLPTTKVIDDVAKGLAPAADAAPKPAEAQKPSVAPTVAPKGVEADLPDNEYGRFYKDLKRKMESGEVASGAMTNALLAVTLWIAKMSKYWHLIPGKFASDVAADTTTRLTPEEEAKLKAAKKLADLKAEEVAAQEAKAKSELEKQLDEEKKAGKKPEIEKYSTKYVCQTLWGIDTIEDSLTLGKKLNNSGAAFSGAEGTVETIPYYKSVSFADFKKNVVVPRSIFIFIPDINTGNKVVAFADEAGTLKYYDAVQRKVIPIDLKNEPAAHTVMMVFVPNSEMQGREEKAETEFVEKIKTFNENSKTAKTLAEKSDKFEEVKTSAESLYAEIALSEEVDRRAKAVLESKDPEKIKNFAATVGNMFDSLTNLKIVYAKYGELNTKEAEKLKKNAEEAKKLAEAYNKQFEEAKAALAQAKPEELTAKDQNKAKKEQAAITANAKAKEQEDLYKETEAEKGVIVQNMAALDKYIKIAEDNKKKFPVSSVTEAPSNA